jgi:lipopolysaccharide biosynthesis glycosyltransferase
MLVYTVSMNNTLNNARILAASLKALHPDWQFCIVHGEALQDGFELQNEPFDKIVFFHELGIPNFDSWIFQFAPEDSLKAIRFLAPDYFFKNSGYDKIIFFSPETLITGNLSKLCDNAENSIILAPVFCDKTSFAKSLTCPEIHKLKNYLYDDGFFCINKTKNGASAAEWLRGLVMKCTTGLNEENNFNMQFFIDIMPYFFNDCNIIQDPGFGVSPINLFERHITENEPNVFAANNNLLRFFHFYGCDTGVGRLTVEYFSKDSASLQNLWQLYEGKLTTQKTDTPNQFECNLNSFDNEERITDDMRSLYKSRPDLQELYRFPRTTRQSDDNFYNFAMKHFLETERLKRTSIFKRFKTILVVLYRYFKFKLFSLKK